MTEKCAAIVKGRRCRNSAVPGEDKCAHHSGRAMARWREISSIYEAYVEEQKGNEK
jgi:hypothetical protein